MGPQAAIGGAVRRERDRVGLTLSALARGAGIAKSTLSQLESGEGNPSIETLWSIATALNVPFSHLFVMPEPRGKLIRADEGEAIQASAADFAAVLLSTGAHAKRHDLYRATVRRGEVRKAKAHSDGSVEHVVVCEGRVRVGPEEAAEMLGVGDYYRYGADVPHSYEAVSETAIMLLVMESPE